jgi:hypothetical protein
MTPPPTCATISTMRGVIGQDLQDEQDAFPRPGPGWAILFIL